MLCLLQLASLVALNRSHRQLHHCLIIGIVLSHLFIPDTKIRCKTVSCVNREEKGTLMRDRRTLTGPMEGLRPAVRAPRGTIALRCRTNSIPFRLVSKRNTKKNVSYNCRVKESRLLNRIYPLSNRPLLAICRPKPNGAVVRVHSSTLLEELCQFGHPCLIRSHNRYLTLPTSGHPIGPSPVLETL